MLRVERFAHGYSQLLDINTWLAENNISVDAIISITNIENCVEVWYKA